MSETFTCWQCGAALTDVILPMSRREECPACRADQHVCKMCKHLDDKGFCREDRAEHQSDLEKANFCDYFSPTNKGVQLTRQQQQQDAKAKLAALFGDTVETQDRADSDHSTQEKQKPLTPAEIAEQKLRDMLGD